jgi:polyhydroxyalkanoate synthesis repressor PhaR
LTLVQARWFVGWSVDRARNFPLDPTDKTDSNDRARRVIKRYSNRKLYDTRESRYVTLLQIADLVRGGEDVQVIDNATKEDKTEVTLALIISEELKSRPRSVPLGTLRGLIHQRGEKLLSQLREGPIGRLIPGSPDDPESPPPLSEGEPLPGSGVMPDGQLGAAAEPTKAAGEAIGKSELSPFEQWRHAIDERIRMILPAFVRTSELQQKVDQLASKLAALEAEVARLANKP